MHIDSISRSSFRVTSYADYQEFKRGLCGINDLEYKDGQSLIIESLSFLHKEDGTL